MAKRESEVPVGLRRVKQKFSSWRKNRVRGDRIPDRLWDAAAKAAREFGVCKTAKVLALDYYTLKRRLGASEHEPASPAFVELTGPPAFAASECIIELEDHAGSSMRMHIKGVDLSTISAVGQSLWGSK